MSEPSVVQVYQGLVSRQIQLPAMVSADASLDLLKSHGAITSDEQAVLVVDLGKTCRLARLELKRQVDTIKAPLKQAGNAVDALTKPKLQGWESGESLAKDLVATWNRKKEAAHSAALAAAQTQENDVPPDQDAPPTAVAFTPAPSSIVRGASGAIYEQTLTKVRITDKAAAMAAAPDLFDLRESDAKRWLQHGRSVPGLELYTEKAQVMR
jgi:hypothetical protein